MYDWVDGVLLRVEPEERTRPGSSFYRFVHQPREAILRALDEIFDVHVRLAERGWIACDFYDGSVIYDFDRKAVHLVDLDLYRQGPFYNGMGRMFGSSRFMAPEEFELGARIDERTTVFTMGRTAAVLLAPGSNGPIEVRRLRRPVRGRRTRLPHGPGSAVPDDGFVLPGVDEGTQRAA